jgi:diaminohydroxyphosphoribosylaminopyrimidine deaminase/5-amino-6-(5-phosphoribosylamino)uracil reductase
MIVTVSAGAARCQARQDLERNGAEIVVAGDETFGSALAALGERQIASLLLEGGGGLHRAAWDEDLVDYVRIYVTPHIVGPGGLRFLEGRPFSTAALLRQIVEPLGPDVVIEGYVHGPR